METSRFACGHENPVGNRYCDTCGATQDARCPFCKSPNRQEARFCGACGTRLPLDGTAPETGAADPLPRRRRGWAGADLASSPIDDDLGREEPEVEARSRWRRELLRLAAVAGLAAVAMAIAVALAVLYFAPARRADLADNSLGEARAGRESTPPARPEQLPQGKKQVPDPSAAPTAGDSTATASLAAQSTSPASDTAEGAAGSATLPARSSGQTGSSEDDATQALAAKASNRAAHSSEERMADFLIEQLGPESAAVKAQSTAAWYDADRSEHGYWQRVADAIRRRSKS